MKNLPTMRPTDIVIDAEKNLRDLLIRVACAPAFWKKRKKTKGKKKLRPCGGRQDKTPSEGGGRGCAVIEEFFLRVYTNKYTNILEADFKMLYLRCKPNI